MEHIGVRELREQLGRRIDAAHFKGEKVVIEKNGEPRAVIVPYEWLVRQSGGEEPDS